MDETAPARGASPPDAREGRVVVALRQVLGVAALRERARTGAAGRALRAVDGARISPYRSSRRRTTSGLCPRSLPAFLESDADASPSRSSYGPRAAGRGG